MAHPSLSFTAPRQWLALGFAFGLLAARPEVIRAAAPGPAAGPLRIHPHNSRYFTDGTTQPDGSLKAVYLTGAHTWNNLVDMAREE